MLLKYAPATGTALLVYLVLLLHADSEGYVSATIAEVAEAAHLHAQTTREILRTLRQAGELMTVTSGNRWHPATWRVTVLGLTKTEAAQ